MLLKKSTHCMQAISKFWGLEIPSWIFTLTWVTGRSKITILYTSMGSEDSFKFWWLKIEFEKFKFSWLTE